MIWGKKSPGVAVRALPLHSTLFLPAHPLLPRPCSSSLPALFAASLLETVTEILEVSGRRAGVAGGESRLKLLAIMREAAGSRAGGATVN